MSSNNEGPRFLTPEEVEYVTSALEGPQDITVQVSSCMRRDLTLMLKNHKIAPLGIEDLRQNLYKIYLK